MNTNTDFDKIDTVLSKNGGGLFCTCWCVGQAIRRARLGLEDDREGLAGSDEKGDEHEKESDRCCLIVGYVMIGHSHIADEVIKDGIKKMIAEYLDKYYVKNY